MPGYTELNIIIGVDQVYHFKCYGDSNGTANIVTKRPIIDYLETDETPLIFYADMCQTRESGNRLQIKQAVTAIVDYT